EHEFFEDEERDDAGEQRAEDRRRFEIGERFGQQRQERDAEQRADGVTDEPRHDARAHAHRKHHEGRSNEKAAAATEETETERRREQMHALSYCGLRIAE